MDTFITFTPLEQALLIGTFTWLMTAFGASFVFASKDFNQRVMDAMLGFAGGVMIAASFWSLLKPAAAMADEAGTSAWIPTATGFILGGFFLWAVDKLLPHLHPNMGLAQAEGIQSHKKKRSTLLVLAITLHNIPEGLAIGVSIGAVSLGGAEFASVLILAVGLGLQNIPEGFAVSMPLRREGLSRRRSFMYGQLSGLVEPVAAVVGVLAVGLFQPLLPYALSFAAGAMIFVVVEEVVPAAHEEGNGDLASAFLIIGFTLMMVLDIMLG
ncbi:ZIP family metal transporter [Aciduricibacillus chroicocephali]|uniref:ZIP family metal transporter n=1 Tax=Aciduricibacillus chroicocephali TaxID=3054939 RepID=A0ABY9KW23_9BACI|nr:ZIP family metal transporter [Bacillaceae bacterium 44XB]